MSCHIRLLLRSRVDRIDLCLTKWCIDSSLTVKMSSDINLTLSLRACDSRWCVNVLCSWVYPVLLDRDETFQLSWRLNSALTCRECPFVWQTVSYLKLGRVIAKPLFKVHLLSINGLLLSLLLCKSLLLRPKVTLVPETSSFKLLLDQLILLVVLVCFDIVLLLLVDCSSVFTQCYLFGQFCAFNRVEKLLEFLLSFPAWNTCIKDW